MSVTPSRSHSAKSAHSSASSATSAGVGRKWLLTFSVVLTLLWSISLLVMDLTTAERPVVSRDQIRKSDCLVVARLVRPGEDKVRVERVFRGDVETGATIRVLNLNNPAGRGVLVGAEDCVLPLTRFRGDYVVTTLDGQTVAPLVYRASPDVIEMVKSILRDNL